MIVRLFRATLAFVMVLTALGVATVEAAERGARPGISSNTIGRDTIQSQVHNRPIVVRLSLSCKMNLPVPTSRYLHVKTSGKQQLPIGTKIKWTIPSVEKSGVHTITTTHHPGYGVSILVYPGDGLTEQATCHAKITK